jgi:hypothetical protein
MSDLDFQLEDDEEKFGGLPAAVPNSPREWEFPSPSIVRPRVKSPATKTPHHFSLHDITLRVPNQIPLYSTHRELSSAPRIYDFIANARSLSPLVESVKNLEKHPQKIPLSRECMSRAQRRAQYHLSHGMSSAAMSTKEICAICGMRNTISTYLAINVWEARVANVHKFDTRNRLLDSKHTQFSRGRRKDAFSLGLWTREATDMRAVLSQHEFDAMKVRAANGGT